MITDIIFTAILAVWIATYWITEKRKNKTEQERNEQLKWLWQSIEQTRRDKKECEQHEQH